MVNITTGDQVVVLYIPANGVAISNGTQLGLWVESTHDRGRKLSWTIQGWELAGTFVKVCAEKPQGLHEGEWEYILVDSEGLVVSRGLMQVGIMPADQPVVEYKKEIEYKEYGN